jgi:homoserine dehydrogenase
VNNEYNAVQISAAFSDKQLMKGKGAGSYPTAAAVLSDISALSYDYRYSYKKIEQLNNLELDNSALLNVYLRYTNIDIFETLHFETVEEEFMSKDYNYIIGKVSIKDLLAAELNNLKGIFIAEVEEPVLKIAGIELGVLNLATQKA